MAKSTKKKDASPMIAKSEGMLESFRTMRNRIKERAYEIFQGRDEEQGDSTSDWLQAESEVLTEIALEMSEEDDRYIISGDMPQFDPDEIEIQLDERMISLGGTHAEESEEKTQSGSRRSRSEVSFFRQMSLPDDVDFDEVAANMEDGRLEVSLPKSKRTS